MRYYRQAALALVLLTALAAGCKSSNKPAQSTTKATRLFAVTVDSAAFFRRGPRQGVDPDLKLPKDTVVRLIRTSFGYSKIQVVTSGVQGYIASEEIRPASSTLLAAATTPPVDSISARTGGEQFNLNSNDPRLVPPPEELPDPDLPAPAPEP
jgi:hypothetical protein